MTDLVRAAAAEMLTRRRARVELRAYMGYVYGDGLTASYFLDRVCAALDQFLLDVDKGLRPILILQAPPQHGKSTIVSRYLPAYILGRDPSLRLAGASYGADLASDMCADVQSIMRRDEYLRLYPATDLTRNVGGRTKITGQRFGVPGHTGSYISVGVGGPLTGKAIDIGIIDDPIKNAAEALSDTVKTGVWNWYTSTFLTRLSKRSGQIIMATSWAMDDLSGRVMDQHNGDPRLRVLRFPAINLPGEAYYDVDMPEGALVPELHPMSQLEEIRGTMSDYFWSAMYQQSPKPSGGNVFSDSCVQYYRVVPERFDRVIQSWDMTFKDTDGSDYVVGQVWGKVGANAYLLAQTRERMTFSRSKAAVKAMSNAWPQAQRKLVEDKANGPAILDSLRAEIHGMIAVEPDGSKLARAYAVADIWEGRNVWLPDPAIAPWIKAYVDELTVFPASSHDDQVDATTQALRDLYPRRRAFFISDEALSQI